MVVLVHGMYTCKIDTVAWCAIQPGLCCVVSEARARGLGSTLWTLQVLGALEKCLDEDLYTCVYVRTIILYITK